MNSIDGFTTKCSKRRRIAHVYLVSVFLLLVSAIPSASGGENYWVAIDHPHASDLNDGRSLVQPFKTLSRAVEALSPGDTLYIKAGVYREPLVISRSGTATAPIVCRAYPGDEGNVVIRGSDVVEGWVHDGGGVWSVPWQPLPLIDYPASWPNVDEYSRRREMVFVNGNPLTQVLSQSGLAVGKFWMDDAAQRIRIQVSGDPNSSQVEIAVRTQGIMARGKTYLVLRGLRVEHVTPDIWIGALATGQYNRVEDCVVEYSNGLGIEAYPNSVFLRTKSNHSGMMGVGLSGNNSEFEYCETSYNSWRYGPEWAAGGVKVVGGGRPSGNRFSHHTARYNNGEGIWFDTTGSGNIVESSFFEGNKISGLDFEATIGPNWAINNVVVGTQKANVSYPRHDGVGIAMREARDTYVYNNTIVGSAQNGILISGGGPDERESGVDYAANTTVYNNIVVDSGAAAVDFWLWGGAVSEPYISSHHLDNNLYYDNSTTIIFADYSNGLWIAWRHWTLDQWQANRSQDLSSVDAPPNFAQPALKDFSLQSTSPAIDGGRNLPQVTDDFAGTSRPHGASTDIGAYESTASPNSVRRSSVRRANPQ